MPSSADVPHWCVFRQYTIHRHGEKMHFIVSLSLFMGTGENSRNTENSNVKSMLILRD